MQFIKGTIALLSKCFDNAIMVVGVLGLIWGISAIFELASSTSNGANAVSFERALWLSGGIVLVIVFVVSFACYTYHYCKTKPKKKIKGIGERVDDLEHELQLIKSDKVKKECDSNTKHDSETINSEKKIKPEDKAIEYALFGTALVAGIVWSIVKSKKKEDN